MQTESKEYYSEDDTLFDNFGSSLCLSEIQQDSKQKFQDFNPNKQQNLKLRSKQVNKQPRKFWSLSQNGDILAPTNLQIKKGVDRVKKILVNPNLTKIVDFLYQFWYANRNQVFDQKVRCSLVEAEPTKMKQIKDLTTNESQKIQQDSQITERKYQSTFLKLNQNQAVERKLVEQSEQINNKQIDSIKFYEDSGIKSKLNTFPGKKHRYCEKIIAARAFCYRGYSIVNLRKQIQEAHLFLEVQNNMFKISTCAFAIQAYRKLEDILIGEFQQNIDRIVGYDVRYLYSLLLNCRKTFPENHVKTYIKIVKFTFDFQAVTLTQNQCSSLLQYIQKQYRKKLRHYKQHEEACWQDQQKQKMRTKKIIEKIKLAAYGKSGQKLQNKKKPNTKNQHSPQFQKPQRIPTGWDLQKQKDLLLYYMKYQTIVSVKDHFEQRFGKGHPFVERKFIKSRFIKCMRTAMRQVRTASQLNLQCLPQLVHLDDVMIKSILQSQDSLEIRVLLCQIALEDKPSNQLFQKTILAINQYSFRKEKLKIKV